MAIISIDTDILRDIITESVREAIKCERLFYQNSIIPPVSNEEMNEIIDTYGNKPEIKDYSDATYLTKHFFSEIIPQ